ncbi:GNAT family N-acetyltransferase [Aminobacter aganoensis]|uniref:Streptothricin acetyltransferase n=1 Tax=Aminobacter aganoensis TaxID=83264 RepID=A0A7X0F9E6_9HYPH|nr:GNAT family N-acetyltransferase [Aminobacter aganoensis]MBB6355384.1 streptothricin acetyltransferase [Aminobacter aganoensis]
MSASDHKIRIVPGSPELLRQLEERDYSFQVAPPLASADAVQAHEPSEQPYGFDARSISGLLSGADGAVFVALLDGMAVGFIAVQKSWNRLATVADLAVDRSARRRKVGRRLMDAAVAWVRDKQLLSIRLETQGNNLPACRFYAAYGFQLGGIDRLLYLATEGNDAAPALFWYLFLDQPGARTGQGSP